MVNYGKSIIYKLVCNDTRITECYVGSSTNYYRRKQQHKLDCNNVNGKEYNHYKYRFIRENGGFNNWSMIIIEEYECNNKRELQQRERYYMELLNAKLNIRKSYITQDEKKEQMKEISKEWRENNKEQN